MFLTKSCMVASGSAEEARDEAEEKLLDRMLMAEACSVADVIVCSLGDGVAGVGVERAVGIAISER